MKKRTIKLIRKRNQQKKIRKPKPVIYLRLAGLFMALTIFLSGPAAGIDIKGHDVKGKVYVSDYYSQDSSNYDFHVLTGRLNLYKREEQKPGIYFEFDGRIRKKIEQGDLRSDVAKYKFDEVWLAYKFPGEKLKAIAGRQYIEEMYNTRIDGLNTQYQFDSGFGVGVFGGLAPDKIDESFGTEYKSIGIYSFYYKDWIRLMTGFEHLRYNGKTDREYASLKVFSKLNEKTRLNAISSVSINQITNNVEVENVNLNLLHSYSKKLRMNVFYNYYRTIKYYESAKYYNAFGDLDNSFLLDTNSQTRTGLRVDYKIKKDLKIYASAAYEKRENTSEDSLRLTGGFRQYDVLGFDISGRYTHISGLGSVSDEYNMEIYRNILNTFDLSVYASHEEEKLDELNAFTTAADTYGASLFWPINKYYYLNAFVERFEDEDYSLTSFFAQLGYKLY
jgi:hypothetical protein